MARGTKRKKTKRTRKQTSYRHLPSSELGEALARSLQRGKFRQSLEVTREMRRRDILDAHRELATRAYEVRAEELATKGLFAESAMVLENAVELELASRPLRDIAFRCALTAGRQDTLRSVLRATDAEQAIEERLLADLSIVQPSSAACPTEDSSEQPAESFALARRSVLSALEHFEEGRHDDARRELTAIGRRSPFAGWRWLVRGLLARAEGNFEEARRCWRSLSPPGACALLAREFLETLPASDTEPPESRAVEARPALVSNSPLRDPRVKLLDEISEHLRAAVRCEEDEEETVEEELIACVKRAARVWPGGLTRSEGHRLFRSIVGSFVLSPLGFDELARALEPLPEDPDGVRQAARHLEDVDVSEACHLWRAHLGDIPRLYQLSATQTRRARAIIWEHLGDLGRLRAAEQLSSLCAFPFLHHRGRHKEDLVDAAALEGYNNSLKLNPGSIEVWRKLASLYRDADQFKDAERTLLDLSKRFPTDVDCIVELGELCFDREAFRKAFRYFEKARALEPLNQRVLERLTECRVESAWKRAKKGRMDLARKDLRDADALQRGSLPPVHQVRWAAMERSAGDHRRADELMESSLSAGLWEPEARLRLYVDLLLLGHDDGAQEEGVLAHRQIQKIRWDPDRLEQTAELYALFRRASEDTKKSDKLWLSIQKAFREHFRKVNRRKVAPELRLSLCHALRRTEDLVLAHEFAVEGRKRFPNSYHFSLLEADLHLLRLPGRTFPKALRKALVRGQQHAIEAGDEEAATSIESFLLLDGETRSRFEPSLEDLEGLFRIFGEELGLDLEGDHFDVELDDESPAQAEEQRTEKRARAEPRRRGRGRRGASAGKTRSDPSPFRQQSFDFF